MMKTYNLPTTAVSLCYGYVLLIMEPLANKHLKKFLDAQLWDNFLHFFLLSPILAIIVDQKVDRTHRRINTS